MLQGHMIKAVIGMIQIIIIIEIGVHPILGVIIEMILGVIIAAILEVILEVIIEGYLIFINE